MDSQPPSPQLPYFLIVVLLLDRDDLLYEVHDSRLCSCISHEVCTLNFLQRMEGDHRFTVTQFTLIFPAFLRNDPNFHVLVESVYFLASSIAQSLLNMPDHVDLGRVGSSLINDLLSRSTAQNTMESERVENMDDSEDPEQHEEQNNFEDRVGSQDANQDEHQHNSANEQVDAMTNAGHGQEQEQEDVDSSDGEPGNNDNNIIDAEDFVREFFFNGENSSFSMFTRQLARFQT